MSFKEKFEEKLEAYAADYNVCGVVSTANKIYPLGSDTKVLSTVFELFARPVIQEFANENGYEMIEPDKQNHYPDFTLQRDSNDSNKIAIDVKTTYVNKTSQKFSYTLGGYTSFIRNSTKNIVFPFEQYSEHWIMGYVYTRIALKKAAKYGIFSLDQIDEIDLPYKDVKTFFQEKWRISGDSAGSGNTTNIGSIRGSIDDFISGNGPFSNEEEFLDYWRNYERTKAERDRKFSNLAGYRRWKAEL